MTVPMLRPVLLALIVAATGLALHFLRLRGDEADGKPLGPMPLEFHHVNDDGQHFAVKPWLRVEEDGWTTEDLPPGRCQVTTPERLGHPTRGRWRLCLERRDGATRVTRR